MNENESKIKFYSLGSEKLDLSKFINDKNSNLPKTVIPSKKFTEALNKVTKKDINVLNRKVQNIISEITKRLVLCNINLNEKLEFEIKDIESLIVKVEEIMSNLIISKEKNKVRLFSSNKKLKKNNLKNIDECILYISKCQVELISMKNEYNKLISRNLFTESILLNDNDLKDDIEDEIENEDPIERTISFYMTNLE